MNKYTVNQLLHVWLLYFILHVSALSIIRYFK